MQSEIENINNPDTAPEGQAVGTDEIKEDSYDQLSDEALEALAKGKPAPVKPVEPAEPVKEGEPPAEPAPAPTEELPDDLKGKSAEELSKAYLNIRKLHAKQDEELGNLRKYKEEADKLDTDMKQYQIDATSRNIVENEIKAMTDAEKQKFYDDFSEDPAKALMPYISKAMKPIAVVQARQATETEISRLIEANKDKRVPYDRKTVEKIVAGFTNENGRNKLFDQYGIKAYEEAYKIYRDQNLDAAIEKEKKEFQEKALKEAEEQARKKSKTYTEPTGVRSAPSGSTDYNNMPMADLERLVGKPKD